MRKLLAREVGKGKQKANFEKSASRESSSLWNRNSKVKRASKREKRRVEEKRKKIKKHLRFLKRLFIICLSVGNDARAETIAFCAAMLDLKGRLTE